MGIEASTSAPLSSRALPFASAAIFVRLPAFGFFIFRPRRRYTEYTRLILYTTSDRTCLCCTCRLPIVRRWHIAFIHACRDMLHLFRRYCWLQPVLTRLGRLPRELQNQHHLDHHHHHQNPTSLTRRHLHHHWKTGPVRPRPTAKCRSHNGSQNH
ncbi:uncharacterized protein BKA78DRAFT_19055 [Phyllosticta capitalensis]|uniref:Uncharacterized protein n=1 Tax=Phyllosticta capitalensis TaxID=121624 RepID=A0ABR1Z4J0_9PEZI